ncbi:hypothetical protein FQN57_007456 [Myotisia sp. PD_48]|nr:hypothetical protein FQN57_007456 [Myotisia sp. PD_48]
MSRPDRMHLQIPRRTSSKSPSAGQSLFRRASRDILKAAANPAPRPHTVNSAPQSERRDSYLLNNADYRRRDDVLEETVVSNWAPNRLTVGGHSSNARGRPTTDNRLSQHQFDLRSRASSPLLGQSYKRVHASYNPTQPKHKPLQPSGSASTHRSFYDPSKSSTALSHKTSASSSRDLATGEEIPTASKSTSDLSIDRTANSTSFKSTKPKRRPPMIDLSKLFPKPRGATAPLLSPHRLTSSPSPVSIQSDAPSYKQPKPDRIHPTGRKLTKAPKAKRSGPMKIQPHNADPPIELQEYYLDRYLQQACNQPKDLLLQQRRQEQQSRPVHHKYEGWRDPAPIRRVVSTNWFDGPEGQVSDVEVAEEGEEEEEDDDNDELFFSDRPRERSYSRQSESEIRFPKPHSHPHGGPSRSSSRTIRVSRSSSSMAKRTPNTKLRAGATNVHSSPHGSQPSNVSDNQLSSHGTITKKSSQLLMNSSNLNESSILCLSSSEDEEDDHDPSDQLSVPVKLTALRDSISTYDDAAQVCTAQAVAAQPRPSITRVRSQSRKKAQSGTTRPQTQVSSTPSSVRSSIVSAEVFSGTSYSGLGPPDPIISLPPPSPLSSNLEFQRIGTSRPPRDRQPPPTVNRRSRFMAVTRQEEHLLELIRRNKGVIPSNIPQDGALLDTGWEAKNFQPNRLSDSSYNSDASYLRPGSGARTHYHHPRALRGAADHHTGADREGSFSQGAPSDGGDQAAEYSSYISSRISLVHSDIYPSPSTNTASPRTPTLPNRHRHLSPRPSEGVPIPNAPASVEDKQHARSRTDSSDAIAFAGNDSSGKDFEPDSDLPIWALGWNNEPTGMSIVH